VPASRNGGFAANCAVVEDAQPREHEQGVPAAASAHDDDAGAPDGLWRFGADAWQAMAERVQDLYGELPRGIATGDLDAELRRLRLDIERGADLVLDVFDRVLALMRRVDGIQASGDHGSGEELAMSVAAGARGSAGLWAHNVSDTTGCQPQVRCGPLTDFDGARIPDDRVRVEAATTPIEARNSRRFELVIDVPRDTAPNCYQGLLLVRGDPDTAIRVRVDVTPA
jgi:hypothetical protein